MEKSELSVLIKNLALDLGFDDCGFASLEPFEEESKFLSQWILEGNNANMSYLSNYQDVRHNPQFLMPGSKSAIMVILNYYPSSLQNEDCKYSVSKYAYSVDYHTIFKEKLKQLILHLKEKVSEIQCRPFTDTAPVFEKALAQRAGLGWIGKNSCLIHPHFGSFVFIGGVLIDQELEYGFPFKNNCGNCNQCLKSCPNNALSGKGSMDARKCISYLTIEHKGDFLLQEKGLTLNNCVFGCDRCQDICPWNEKLAKPRKDDLFNINSFIQKGTDNQWDNLTEQDFRIQFSNSPFKRTGYQGIKRNIKHSAL